MMIGGTKLVLHSTNIYVQALNTLFFTCWYVSGNYLLFWKFAALGILPFATFPFWKIFAVTGRHHVVWVLPHGRIFSKHLGRNWRFGWLEQIQNQHSMFFDFIGFVEPCLMWATTDISIGMTAVLFSDPIQNFTIWCCQRTPGHLQLGKEDCSGFEHWQIFCFLINNNFGKNHDWDPSQANHSQN